MLFIALTHPAPAQSTPSVTATLRPVDPEAQVGDPIRLLLEVRAPKSADNLTMPQVADSLGPALYCLDRGKVKKSEGSDLTIYEQELTVAGYDSGRIMVPALKGFASGPGGQTQSFSTEPVALEIFMVPVDTTQDIRPIKDVLEPRESFLERYWPYLLGAVLLAAFLVAWRLLRRKKPTPAPVVIPSAPPETPAAIALRNLDQLMHESLWQRGNVKEYYVRLSGILRAFIKAEHRIDAPEMLSDELLSAARNHAALKPFVTMMADILRPADMAKFARAQPLPEDHIRAMQNARAIVQAPGKHPSNPTEEPVP